jgi:hypothetical protein
MLTPPCTNNRQFHQRHKRATMFDEVSLSHMLRHPGPFVRNGWSYGEALGHFILEQALLPGSAPRIVEIGGGLGDVAATLLPVLARAGKRPDYTIVDLSSRLQLAQAERLRGVEPPVRFVKGEAEKLEKVIHRADFILSNEVIGDLRTIDHIPLCRGGEPSGIAGGFEKRYRRYWDLAWDVIDRYGLEIPNATASDSFALNWGAIKVVEALWRVLPSRGAALLIENATPFAVRIELPSHREYSVSMRHLATVSTKLGFHHEIGTVGSILGLDPEPVVVSPLDVEKWIVQQAVSPDNDRVWRMLRNRGDVLQAGLRDLRSQLGGTTRLDFAVSPRDFQGMLSKAGLDVGWPGVEILGRYFSYFMFRKP